MLRGECSLIIFLALALASSGTKLTRMGMRLQINLPHFCVISRRSQNAEQSGVWMNVTPGIQFIEIPLTVSFLVGMR